MSRFLLEITSPSQEDRPRPPWGAEGLGVRVRSGPRSLGDRERPRSYFSDVGFSKLSSRDRVPVSSAFTVACFAEKSYVVAGAFICQLCCVA